MDRDANLLGLIGLLMLFVPAVYGASILWKASRVSARAGLYDDGEIEEKRNEVVKEILDLQNQWNPWLAFFLFGGMALGVIAYVVLLWPTVFPS